MICGRSHDIRCRIRYLRHWRKRQLAVFLRKLPTTKAATGRADVPDSRPEAADSPADAADSRAQAADSRADGAITRADATDETADDAHGDEIAAVTVAKGTVTSRDVSRLFSESRIRLP